MRSRVERTGINPRDERESARESIRLLSVGATRPQREERCSRAEQTERGECRTAALYLRVYRCLFMYSTIREADINDNAGDEELNERQRDEGEGRGGGRRGCGIDKY